MEFSLLYLQKHSPLQTLPTSNFCHWFSAVFYLLLQFLKKYVQGLFIHRRIKRYFAERQHWITSTDKRWLPRWVERSILLTSGCLWILRLLDFRTLCYISSNKHQWRSAAVNCNLLHSWLICFGYHSNLWSVVRGAFEFRCHDWCVCEGRYIMSEMFFLYCCTACRR